MQPHTLHCTTWEEGNPRDVPAALTQPRERRPGAPQRWAEVPPEQSSPKLGKNSIRKEQQPELLLTSALLIKAF